MEHENAYKFWQRFDSVNTMQLKDLCLNEGLNYNTLRSNRSSLRFPNLTDAYILAQALNTTVEFLLTGVESNIPSGEDRKLLQAYHSHPEFQEAVKHLLGIDGHPAVVAVATESTSPYIFSSSQNMD